NRTFIASAEGKQGLLQDRPTTILVSAGGILQGGNPQPDFLTPYLTLILNTIGIQDIHFVYLQGLAFGEPAIAQAWHQAQTALVEAGVLTNPIKPATRIDGERQVLPAADNPLRVQDSID
ncbi:MAG: NAD(P)H-dependent oxidoreductase, partial [Halomonas sp.]|uniref:NAD(P)H-dependent oxidoreductase n=1 Tax=Halomonas sp. TaxID=1486246 RepID=UPI003F90E72A